MDNEWPFMHELRPCPFCGNQNLLLRNIEYDKTLWIISCKTCQSEFTVSRWMYGEKKDNRDRLIETWNRRI